jgi:hypothetical protein
MIAFIKKYRRAIIISFVVIALLFAGSVYFAIRAVNDLFETSKVTPTAPEYAEWVRVWLPESTRDFQAYGEGWQDWYVEARFDIPVSELPEFISKNKLQRSEASDVPKSQFDLEWFRPTGKLEAYELIPAPDAALMTTTGFYPSFWIDRSDAEQVIVYIVAFDT